MNNDLLTKNYVADGAVGQHLIVAFGTAAGTAAQAANNADTLMGVSNELSALTGERVDVKIFGIVPVRYGGGVAKGDPLTAKSDGSGKAVKAIASPGTVVRIIGFAEEDGVNDDIGSVRLMPGFLSNDSTAYTLVLPEIDLVGTNAAKKYVAVPLSGTIVKIQSVTNGALTVGDATLTAKINGTAVTNGAITIAQTDSAAGDVDTATPTALNVVAQGDVIEIDAGGTNTASKTATVTITIGS